MYQPFHDSDGITVHNGDVIDMLAHLEPGSIDAVVTSPPYAMQRASTYGGVPGADYPDWTVEWMSALKPALTERGSVMLNISPHVKGGMLADYVLRMRLALRADGWCEHQELVWHKKGPMPSGNVKFPQRAWESIFWYSRTPKPFSDPVRGGNVQTLPVSAGVTGRSHSVGYGHYGKGEKAMSAKRSRVRDVLSLHQGGAPSHSEFHHPAPFPVALADWLMKINTPDGGTVLDPFAGSGTTAVAALRNSFQSVAIEREPEYAQMIVDRYKEELAKRNEGLFDAEVAA